jgi:hypothetical protein
MEKNGYLTHWCCALADTVIADGIKLGQIGLGFVSLRHFYPITKPVSEHHLLKIALWFLDKQ